MVAPGYERHGVYHIATRGGHEASIVIIDDDVGGAFEGFRCDVHDVTHGNPSNVKQHNAHVVVGDEVVTVEPDAVDFSVFFGGLRSDRIDRVEFPDLNEPHSNRYTNLADAYGYEPDVGDRNAPSAEGESIPRSVKGDSDE